jgi:hypothetical protein
MKKELVAIYFDKWNCVWNNGLSQTKNIQDVNEIINMIKNNFSFLQSEEFIIEDNEIYVFIDLEKHTTVYNNS